MQITGAGGVSFFHRDFLGSVVAITNSSGIVTSKYAYGPYGESSALSGTIFGFTGQRYDSETGLYYYKARYYSPNLGRFLQTDPIGYNSGLNLYAYVNNSPLNAIDPSGQSLAELLGGLFLIIIVGAVAYFYNQNKNTIQDVNGTKVIVNKDGTVTLADGRALTKQQPILIEDGRTVIRTKPNGEAVYDSNGNPQTIPVLRDGNGDPFYFDEFGKRVDIKDPKSQIYNPPPPDGMLPSPTQYVNKWTGTTMNTAWGTNGDSPTTYVNQWTGTVMNTAWGTNGDSPTTYYNQWTGTTMNSDWGTNGESPTTYYNQWTGTEMNTAWGTNGGKVA